MFDVSNRNDNRDVVVLNDFSFQSFRDQSEFEFKSERMKFKDTRTKTGFIMAGCVS